jgi:predicted lysophospholipase L1 biosynthesis ABC-type transport system permease subunit
VITVGGCPDGQYAVGIPGWTSTLARLEPLTDAVARGELGDYDVVAVARASDLPAAFFDDATEVGQILVGTDGDPASVERVRTALEVGHPDWIIQTPAQQVSQSYSQISEIGWIVVLGTIGTLIMAGCSLAVAVAGGLVERRRPFALLRLTGMPVGRLRSVILLEAAPPLLVAAAASAVLGVLVADALLSAASIDGTPTPDLALLPLLAAGVALALGIVALTFPLLGRVTSTESTRFE